MLVRFFMVSGSSLNQKAICRIRYRIRNALEIFNACLDYKLFAYFFCMLHGIGQMHHHSSSIVGKSEKYRLIKSAFRKIAHFV